MSKTQGGGTPTFLDSVIQQTQLVNAILRSYHMNYTIEKIQVDPKEKAVYYITKIYCDEGYEYICERLIDEYVDQAKKQKRNDVDLSNIESQNKGENNK